MEDTWVWRGRKIHPGGLTEQIAVPGHLVKKKKRCKKTPKKKREKKSEISTAVTQFL